MILVDALYFLLLIEAAVLMSALSLYLYLKMKKFRGLKINAEKPAEEGFGLFLQKQIQEQLENSGGLPGESADNDIDDRVAEEMVSLRVRFLSGILTALANGVSSHNVLWENILRNHEDIIKATLADKKALLSEAESLREKLIEMENALTVKPETRQEEQQGAGPDSVLEENKKLRSTIQELEKNLENKIKELSDLQESFDSLEKEYLVLYKEANRGAS